MVISVITEVANNEVGNTIPEECEQLMSVMSLWEIDIRCCERCQGVREASGNVTRVMSVMPPQAPG